MTYEVDARSADVVDGYGMIGRWVQMLLIVLIGVGLPICLFYLFEGKKDDPFEPGSRYYPTVLILIFAVPIFLFGYCFYYLKKGFKLLTIDPVGRSMQLTWQGFLGEWREDIPFESIKGFFVQYVAISKYRRGWELRAELITGQKMRLAQFSKEEAALEAMGSLSNFVQLTG